MELELGRKKMVRAREKKGKPSGGWPQLTCPQFPFCSNIKQSNQPIQNFWSSKIKK
jgi:hypothetical protein